MPYTVEVVPGILESTQELIVAGVQSVSFSPHIHVDFMDGDFVESMNWPFVGDGWHRLESMAQSHDLFFNTSSTIEAHLMATQPTRLGELLVQCGVKKIVAHIESFRDESGARIAFDAWRAAGAQSVGASVLLSTPLEKIDSLIRNSTVDYVQVMGIEKVGFQKQPLDPRSLERLEQLRERYPNSVLQIDGGVNDENIEDVVRAGARTIVIGSAVVSSNDPYGSYTKMQERARAVV